MYETFYLCFFVKTNYIYRLPQKHYRLPQTYCNVNLMVVSYIQETVLNTCESLKTREESEIEDALLLCKTA